VDKNNFLFVQLGVWAEAEEQINSKRFQWQTFGEACIVKILYKSIRIAAFSITYL